MFSTLKNWMHKKETVTFDKVLLVNDGEQVKVGTPLVEGAKVTGKVLKHGKGKKSPCLNINRKRITNGKKGIVSRLPKWSSAALKPNDPGSGEA